ncbi:hypothetical protein BU17DRAFT_61871 [Hysterangium stoloniferum]|nr:hypothetical protein BU17DRAFT_61871 [Hysterangium stoloniferum]
MPKYMTSPHDLRPKTPPSSTSDHTKLGGTPILKKESTSQIFSSNHLARDARITTMSQEISGRVVGPVKVEDFLCQYLRRAPNPCLRITAKTYKSFSESSSEFVMYRPWINLMKPFCPYLELMDTHVTPAVEFGGKQVKPDIQIYSAKCKRSSLSDMTQTEMTVKFKKAVVDDAFNDNLPFEHTSKYAHDTLGQITLYAMAHQAAQFRTHVFLVLVFPHYARFMRWDRSGVIVTEKVPFSNPSYVEFFWWFSHTSPASRGINTTATEFPHNHPAAIRAKRSLNLEDGSPLGHSTRVFKAYCVKTGTLVLLKDMWRVVSATQTFKHMIYQQLRQHGVRNICTCKEGCDVLDQSTKMQDWNTREMVTVVRDAIIAHGDAYDKAEILHRDISSGNILITATGGGLLIDWDLCKKLEHIHQGQENIERTGTWQFMAAHLLVVPTPGQRGAIPDWANDLESFFHVLVWIALRYTKHSFFKNVLTDMLHATFDHHYLDPDGAAKGGDRKKVEVQTSDPFQVSRLFNVPLKELIKTLAKTFAV